MQRFINYLKAHQKGSSFIIFFFFLITFITARTWTYLAVKNLVPDSLTENIRGVHVHHFAWGILLNTVIGYLCFVLPRHYFEKWKTTLAVFFGFGMGLTFDEFGMWLRLADDYWLRNSYDAVIIVTILFINLIYFDNSGKDFFGKFTKSLPAVKLLKSTAEFFQKLNRPRLHLFCHLDFDNPFIRLSVKN